MLLLAGPGAGCASNSGRSYTPSEARTAQTVRTGTITHIGQAVIEEDSSLLGPIVGGVAGGVVGSLFGSGAGKVLTTLGGAGAGALAGAATEKTARTDKALEITIELENGQTISVVQVDDDVFTVGDKVRVVYGAGGKARVQHF
jgi:outer membrane lipoprotein SlyB